MKKFKYQISPDDSLNDISRAVSNEAMTMRRDKMSEKISENPIITTVDYRTGKKEIDLENSSEFSSAKSPYDMYSHVGENGKITTTRNTPERDHNIEEIFMDGTKKLSSRNDFEEKIKNQSVSDEEISELGRIVRVSSDNAEDYANSEKRNASAYRAFDADKYKIEETAARTGLPPSLLSSVYFKTMADKGSLTADAPSLRYARLSYHRLYGQPLSWDDETLSEYLSTPDGALDFIAIGLRSEAQYLGYDPGILTKGQMSDMLSEYGKWNNKKPGFESAVIEFNSVFDGIYKKIPSKDYEVKLR